MKLTDLWERLGAAFASDSVFVGSEIVSRPGDFIAKNSSGCPVVFIAIGNEERYFPPISLKHLSVEFLVECRIRLDDGGEVLGKFAVISCESLEPKLQRFFLQSIDAILQELPLPCTPANLQGLVESVVELFRALQRPAKSTVVGLWGELLLIFEAADIATWSSAWHATNAERFDYSFGLLKVEAKTTTAENRIHTFSLNQLRASERGICWIASICLTQSVTGLGVLELGELICERLRVINDGLCSKIWRNISTALGCDFEDSMEFRFDLELARDSARLVRSSNIGRPLVDDARIGEVRFEFDASQTVAEVGLRFNRGVGILDEARDLASQN